MREKLKRSATTTMPIRAEAGRCFCREAVEDEEGEGTGGDIDGLGSS
jgi:hypothetical protein